MGTRVAARDARVLEKAREALRTLVDVGDHGATGIGLFGDDWKGRWGEKLIKRLVAQRLVMDVGYAPQTGTGRRPKLYAATDALGALSHEDEWLSSMLWPSGGAPREHMFQDTENDLASVPPPATPTVEDAVEQFKERLDAGETLEALLKLAAATLENVAYMREQINALTRDVEELKKVWTS